MYYPIQAKLKEVCYPEMAGIYIRFTGILILKAPIFLKNMLPLINRGKVQPFYIINPLIQLKTHLAGIRL
jgi:hypothetical protein